MYVDEAAVVSMLDADRAVVGRSPLKSNLFVSET